MTTDTDDAVSALLTKDLLVGYRTRRTTCAVLKPVNLVAGRGQLVCLLGVNGSGKSTLLRTVVGLQPPLQGQIAVEGIEITKLAPSDLARLVGVVLTERAAIDALSVRTVVALGRFAHSGWLGILTHKDRCAVDGALGAVNVTHLANRDFSRLSDGERQRVMIARALAQEPCLLVLDEPTAFLDVAARAEVWRLLQRLAAERGLAVLASTHDLEWALAAADLVWLLMPDHTIAVGTPHDLMSGGALEAAFGVRSAAAIEPPNVASSQPRRREDGSTMRSISTMRGDDGETSLAGGIRVSKASVRVETYGTIDELNAALGLARSICADPEIAGFAKSIQLDLFKVGSSLATPADSVKPQVVIDASLVERLTTEVRRIESIEGVLGDWSVAGEHTAAAAFDVARTVCRRAERAVVRLHDDGITLQPTLLAYLNRLSDLLWLFGRKLERDAGVSGSLRALTDKPGNRFSRAW
jgi:iron complex transport system ATP-binding protein